MKVLKGIVLAMLVALTAVGCATRSDRPLDGAAIHAAMQPHYDQQSLDDQLSELLFNYHVIDGYWWQHETNTIVLSATQAEQICRFGAHLKSFFDNDSALEGVYLVIEGRADITGEAQRNQDLSEMRAEHVKALLVKGGAPSARLVAVGVGTRDARQNPTPAEAAEDRQTVLKLSYR